MELSLKFPKVNRGKAPRAETAFYHIRTPFRLRYFPFLTTSRKRPCTTTRVTINTTNRTTIIKQICLLRTYLSVPKNNIVRIKYEYTNCPCISVQGGVLCGSSLLADLVYTHRFYCPAQLVRSAYFVGGFTRSGLLGCGSSRGRRCLPFSPPGTCLQVHRTKGSQHSHCSSMLVEIYRRTSSHIRRQSKTRNKNGTVHGLGRTNSRTWPDGVI